MSNLRQIKSLYKKSMVKLAEAMAEECRKVTMEDHSYGFQNETKRKNGDVVGDPRDTVDTGAFLEGIKTEGNAVAFTAEHSGVVLNGMRTRDGYIPPRNILGIAKTRLKGSGKVKQIITKTTKAKNS